MIEIKVGKLYNYKRPGWDKAIKCKGVSRNGYLGLLFHEDYYPTKVKNLPFDAIIVEVEQDD